MQATNYSAIISEWNWARGLSLDLLKALSKDDIHKQPLTITGSWGKQFRHLGRVQENYISAINTGEVVFSTINCTYTGAINQESLIEYLIKLDQILITALNSEIKTINWFGEAWSIEKHLQAMISHEILHHGQLILYAKISQFALPSSWNAWGE
jgi:hypothetical protein